MKPWRSPAASPPPSPSTSSTACSTRSRAACFRNRVTALCPSDGPWVPHPSDVFVFVARMGYHDTRPSRLNSKFHPCPSPSIIHLRDGILEAMRPSPPHALLFATLLAAPHLHAQIGTIPGVAAGTAVLPNGRELHPAGNWVPLAPYPFALAVSPDGIHIAAPS